MMSGSEVTRYVSVEDIETLWRPLTEEEHRRAEALLPIVESSLVVEARKVGKDLYFRANTDDEYKNVLVSVIVDVVARTLMTSTNQEPMTQMTQSAGGYSASGTFLVPGGGLFIKKSELARLGLRRQRSGVISFYG